MKDPGLATAVPPREDVLERAVSVLASVGDEFLPAALGELSRALDAQVALVGELLPGGEIQTLALCRDGRAAPNFTYVPRHAPAGMPPSQAFFCGPHDARNCLPSPADAGVGPGGWCAGILLGSSKGEPIGVLLASIPEPLNDERHAAMLLTLFAGRAAGEMQRARTERELRSHHEHLLQVQRVEAIGRLAGGVAHDFNNLLMIVIGYAEILKERHGTSPEVTELMAAATRATTLTRQLLAFGRRQVLQAQRLDLNQVVAQVQAMLAPVIGGHVSMAMTLASTLPCIEADPGQLEQVIVNLALNARDAMPDGGDIGIETRFEQVDAAIAQMPAGRYVCLAISDTGVGMTSDVQAHIFEPFYTTKGSGGNGLGLSSVYGIVKQSGGYIWCTTAPGEGTTFRIYFKPVDCADAPLIDAASGPQAAERRVERVLVVDDEPGVRRLLVRVLGAKGFAVSEASNGTEALESLARAASPFDLVVSDIVMPGMDGVALTQAIASRWPRAKVLLMSGYAHAAPKHASRIPPHVPFLPKPFSAGQLAETVRQVIDGSPAASSPDQGR